MDLFMIWFARSCTSSEQTQKLAHRHIRQRYQLLTEFESITLWGHIVQLQGMWDIQMSQWSNVVTNAHVRAPKHIVKFAVARDRQHQSRIIILCASHSIQTQVLDSSFLNHSFTLPWMTIVCPACAQVKINLDVSPFCKMIPPNNHFIISTFNPGQVTHLSPLRRACMAAQSVTTIPDNVVKRPASPGIYWLLLALVWGAITYDFRSFLVVIQEPWPHSDMSVTSSIRMSYPIETPPWYQLSTRQHTSTYPVSFYRIPNAVDNSCEPTCHKRGWNGCMTPFLTVSLHVSSFRGWVSVLPFELIFSYFDLTLQYILLSPQNLTFFSHWVHMCYIYIWLLFL